MTNNADDIKDAVREMVPHGTTYIPAGLIWGWRTLQDAQPLTHIQQAPENSEKIMVLMTDGANEVSLGESVPWSNGIFHTGEDIDAADALTPELCQRMKSEDIIIYTIALEVDDADTATLMRNCATSQAHFYDLSDESALSNAFKISVSRWKIFVCLIKDKRSSRAAIMRRGTSLAIALPSECGLV